MRSKLHTSPAEVTVVARSYRVGHVYKDTGSTSKEGDQFLAWLNIPGSGMLNSPGIRPLKYLHSLSDLPAYVVLVTHEKTGGRNNPWDDIVDYGAAQILYWGDAKSHERKRCEDFDGNKVLSRIHDAVLEGKAQLLPPILHFTKPQKGQVVFSGLCALTDLQRSWFDDHGTPVRNYRAILTILDVDEVKVDWLHGRVVAKSPGALDIEAPKAWRLFLKGDLRKLNLWRSKIRSTEEQLPDPESPDARILEQLHKLTPSDFEAVAVALFRDNSSVCHSVTATRPTADGGFDFFGTFVLPRPFGYHIEFLGEAKKYVRSSPVQPKDVSRLVARLGRGQYGIFVTTSYFTKQAQQEVLQDRYPVHLIAGQDLINLMYESRIIAGGKLNQDWLAGVLSDKKSSGC
jgi:hypothetical protein